VRAGVGDVLGDGERLVGVVHAAVERVLRRLDDLVLAA